MCFTVQYDDADDAQLLSSSYPSSSSSHRPSNVNGIHHNQYEDHHTYSMDHHAPSMNYRDHARDREGMICVC